MDNLQHLNNNQNELCLDSLYCLQQQFYQIAMKSTIGIALLSLSLIIYGLFNIPYSSIHTKAPSLTKQSSPQIQISQPNNHDGNNMKFSQWCNHYNKHYQSQSENHYRQQIYLRNQLQIASHNLKYEMKLTSYKQGINAYSDLTDDQFKHKYTWKQSINPLTVTTNCIGAIAESPNPPDELDWLAKGKVNKVVGKQGDCGKDWAMVATSAVQSLYALRTGIFQQLSTQQLVDCSGIYGNQGCNGGFMNQAFYYIIDNGITTSKQYPDGPVSNCKYNLNMKYTGISRCANINTKIYIKLLSAVIQQPVSTALDFSFAMTKYTEGVFDGQCTDNLNHGMLITGYGSLQGKLYWRLRNTLGVEWGKLGGYILIERWEVDGPGKCGIQLMASVPQGLN